MPVSFSFRSPAASSSASRANTPDLFAEFTHLSPSPPPPSPIQPVRLSPQPFTPARLDALLDESMPAFDVNTFASPSSDNSALDYDFFRDPGQILSAPETANVTPQLTRASSPAPLVTAPQATLPKKRTNIWQMNNVMVTRLKGTKTINPATGQPYMKGDAGIPDGMMTHATYNQQRLVNPKDGSVLFNPLTTTPYIFGDADAPASGMRYDVYNKKRLVNPDTGDFVLNPMTRTPYMEGDPNAPKDAVTFISRQRISTKRKRQEKAATAKNERAAKRHAAAQDSARFTLPALLPKPSAA